MTEGPTGAGKSTLIKLILRFYDPSSGAVRLDGIDLRDLALADLRRNIALVSQDVYLFHGTIRENIAYRDAEVPLEEVVRAAKLAQLHDFVATLPDGYDTPVGERGIQLSGASASASRSRAPSSKTRRSSSSTRPPAPSTRRPSGPSRRTCAR